MQTFYITSKSYITLLNPVELYHFSVSQYFSIYLSEWLFITELTYMFILLCTTGGYTAFLSMYLQTAYVYMYGSVLHVNVWRDYELLPLLPSVDEFTHKSPPSLFETYPLSYSPLFLFLHLTVSVRSNAQMWHIRTVWIKPFLLSTECQYYML